MYMNESDPMNNPENEHIEATVTLIAPGGLGFGEGGISVEKQIEQGILTKEVPGHVHEVLTHNPAVFKRVQQKDSGCGDGREWQKITQVVDGQLRFYGNSHLRAKVFGGGLTVATSMLRTIQGASNPSRTLSQDRAFMIDKLNEYDFSHGAHTDDHASGDNCGCGAIDNYEKITANAIKYRAEITESLKAVYGDRYADNDAVIQQAFAQYDGLASNDAYFADTNGKKSMEQILESGAVVKELSGHHVEETIVINWVKGTTLDQQLFTQEVKNACIEKPKTVQAFSVDAWHGEEIAETATAIALEEDPTLDRETTYKLALADFWIRTLATAGTLTAGDLPVYVRQPLEQSTPQLELAVAASEAE